MSLKIITFANHKGGVSKTTSTASIGACMARMGKKVLLIDLDGQANLTLYFIPNEDEVQASIFDSLVDGAPLTVKHIRENLDLVPSSLEMASAEIALTNLLAREQLLSRLLEPVKQNYDYILIDCPPSLGIVTTNTFLAADEIIVPMTPELLPLKGMRMLDSFVSTLQRVKPNLRLGGVFIARFNHRKLNKVVEQAVKSRYETITMQTRIRENIALAESAGNGQSIFEYDPQSNGAKDYQALTEEIISRNQLRLWQRRIWTSCLATFSERLLFIRRTDLTSLLGILRSNRFLLPAIRQRAIRPMMNPGDISPLSAQRNSLTRFRASPERKVSPSAPSWNTS